MKIKQVIFIIFSISISIQQDDRFKGTFNSHECSVQTQQDGAEYFENLYQTFLNAKHEILICGWKIIPETIIHNRGLENNVTLQQAVKDAVNRGVKIYVLFWNSFGLYLFGRDWLGMHLPESLKNMKETGAYVLEDSGRQWIPNIKWAQHQKFVVVDRQIAFNGGIDIANGRWDTSDHILDDKRRTEHSDESGEFEKMKDYKPWHDIQISITGDAVKDVYETFLQRWYTYCDQFFLFKKPQGCSQNERPPLNLKVDINPKIENKEKTDYCQVTRSCSSWNCGSKTETDIYESIKWIIKKSENYLYFENQYILSKPFSQNEIAQLVIEKIKSKILAMQKFKTFIVFPIACEENRLAIATRLTLFFGEEGFYNQLNNFINKLKQQKDKYPIRFQEWIQNITYHDYFNIAFIGSTLIKKDQNQAGFRSIFLHSKIVIGDDKYVSVGSANWNDRSYFPHRDSELNIFVEPKKLINAKLNNQIVQKGYYARLLRIQLMRENLGYSKIPLDNEYDELFEDPLDDQFYKGLYINITKTNQKIIQNVFQIDFKNLDIKNDFDQIASGIKTISLNDDNLNQLSQIKGHLIYYSLKTWGTDIEQTKSILDYLPFVKDAYEFRMPDKLFEETLINKNEQKLENKYTN